MVILSDAGSGNEHRYPGISQMGSLHWKIPQLFELLYDLAMDQVVRHSELELIYKEFFDYDEGRNFQAKGIAGCDLR